MKTIFGVATAMAKSGVAVIRISGSACDEVLKAFGVKAIEPRKAVLKKLRHNGQIIDEALVLYFQGPNSFTGEDVVELHTHGSRAVIKAVLSILETLPELRMAEPGEFSRRAFENGRMDLTEAEGLADLIDAETEAQAKQAIRQMQGQMGEVYEDWRSMLIRNLAHIEAYIDFPDEDLPASLSGEIVSGVDELKKKLQHYLNDNRRGEKIREGIYVAIIGAPNVGKSSLLNYLAGREAAIVSEIAGTTRDVIEVHMEIGGYAVTLADTAGLRETEDAIESEGIKRALARAESADIRVLMVEAGSSDITALELRDDNSIVLVNKVDMAKPELPDGSLAVSIKDNRGLDEFVDALKDRLCLMFDKGEAPLITRARHREALVKALAALENFQTEKPIELMAEDLRYAAYEIGRITGKIEVDDILDVIFSSFCIGK